MSKPFDLETLTDEEITDLPPAELHAAAAALLDDYARRRTVATVVMSDAVLGHSGALTAIDDTLSVLRRAYADRDPQVKIRFGDIELHVRLDDDGLRDNLRYAARRAREKAASAVAD